VADSFSVFLESLTEDPDYEPFETIEEFIVIETGDFERLQQYFIDGGDVEKRNKRGATLLMRAANSRRQPMVSLLLTKGADVNAVDNEGCHALFS